MIFDYKAIILRGWPAQGARERTEFVGPSAVVGNGDWVEMQPDGTIALTSIANTHRAALVLRGTKDSTSDANIYGSAMTPGPQKSIVAMNAVAGSSGSYFITVQVTAHGYQAGNTVTVSGVTTTAVNGTYIVTSVVDSNNFVIEISTNPGAITVGSGVVYLVTGYVTNGAATVLWGNYIVATSNYDTARTYVPGSPLCVRSGLLTLANGAAGTAIASTSITESGTTVTYTTATAHGFYTGQLVTITGATPAQYNGTYTITSVPTSTTFTYTISTTGVGAATVQGSAVTSADPEIGFVLRVNGAVAAIDGNSATPANLVAVIY